MSVRERTSLFLMEARNPVVGNALEDITRRFAEGFPEAVPRPRTVGREAEFPLVDEGGHAAAASRLWPALLENRDVEPVYDEKSDGSEFLIGVCHERWTCVIEVGKGTVEVSVGPRTTLHDLASDFDAAMERVGGVARGMGLNLLGYGIQPLTPASGELLTPKRRYGALLDAIGAGWLAFCVTAGDQAQVDIGRAEVVKAMNAMNAASGAVIALTANSPVYGGEAGVFAAGRHGLVHGIAGEPHRHGPAPRRYRDLEDYVRFLAGLRCLCLPDSHGGYRLPRGSFADALSGFRDDPEAAYEAFLFHEHYVWGDARPRARIGTLEVRPACQQPASRSWTPSALALGLVEARDDFEAFVREALGRDFRRDLMLHRERAMKAGTSEPFPGFLDGVLDVARRGLRGRGFGEETFLAPLEERRSPADEARRAFERGGVRRLVSERAVN